jgi:Holliday junction resolvasome RuvABC ATP-dependent DNA helicase subunit
VSQLLEKLIQYAKAGDINVMLIGTHGIGKTSLFNEVVKQLGLKSKYYSTPTLDPWVDVVGVPVPEKETGTLRFYRPKSLEEAEIVFFDELNRAHPRVLNSVLEIVQFKTINGVKLPNLKMVWCAINPPGGDYQVEDLDPALIDRFQVYIQMPASIDLAYMKTKMNENVAKILSEWWDEDLNDEQRKHITPRRIEYIGNMISRQIPWKDAIPKGQTTFPIKDLDHRLSMIDNDGDGNVITREDILQNTDKYIARMKQDASIGLKLQSYITRFNKDELFKTRDLIELMQPDHIVNVAQKKFPELKRQLKELFTSNNVDIKKYPKMSKAFDFEKAT